MNLTRIFSSDGVLRSTDRNFYQRLPAKPPLLMVLTVILTYAILADSVQPAIAQTPKKMANAPKKTGKSQKNVGGKNIDDNIEAENELPNLSFNYESELQDHTVVDPDETEDGKSRLIEVTNRAKEVFREADVVRKERAPIAARRDRWLGEISLRKDAIGNCQVSIANAEAAIARIQVGILNDEQKAQQTKAVIANTAPIVKQKAALESEVDNIIKTKLDPLNIEIRPLDERLRKLFEELNACRKQWLDIRVPIEKFARAEYENLKRVIDDWARVDGLWPQAFCWSAICAFELGDYEAAWEMVEKADKIRIEVLNSKKAWPQIEALRALIAVNIPRLRAKYDGWIKDALSGLNRNEDWETYFIVGRAQSQKPREAQKALTNYNHALRIKPNCLSAQYQLAVLQTSANSGAPNLSAGTKQLEELWKKTGKRSWRIGYALAMAYKAAERNDEVKSISEDIFELAPAEKVAKMRQELSK